MKFIKVIYIFCFVFSTTIYCSNIIKVENRTIKIDDEYFFPIALYMQSPNDISYQKSLGINTFILNGDWQKFSNISFLDSCKKNSVWGIINHIESQKIKHDALMGWYLFDEPDIHGQNPKELIEKHKFLKNHYPNKITMLGIGSGFSRLRGKKESDYVSDKLYKKYFLASDIINFNYYPVYNCEPENIFLIGELQKEFSKIIPNNKVPLQFIECVNGTTSSCSNSDRFDNYGINPQELENHVWQAIINGAKGIIYYTHYLDYGTSRFLLDDHLVKKMTYINSVIDKFKSAILNKNSSTEFQSNFPNDIDLVAKNHNDNIILFVANTSNSPREILIYTNIDLMGKTIEKYSGDIIISNKNSFNDRIEPLEVCIYTISD